MEPVDMIDDITFVGMHIKTTLRNKAFKILDILKVDVLLSSFRGIELFLSKASASYRSWLIHNHRIANNSLPFPV